MNDVKKSEVAYIMMDRTGWVDKSKSEIKLSDDEGIEVRGYQICRSFQTITTFDPEQNTSFHSQHNFHALMMYNKPMFEGSKFK